MSSIEVRAYFDPTTWTASYLVVDPTTRDAVIIDPVLDYDPVTSQTSTESVERIIKAIAENRYNLRAVLETHAHADHLSGAAYLRAVYSVPIAISARIGEVQEVFARLLDMPKSVATDGSQFDDLLEGGKEYQWGSLRVRALATPGHTPACLSYLIGDAVFTGDALFVEDYGTGRTDFPGGSAEALYSSVRDVLYELPETTRVFVGHDYQPGGREFVCESTIARERARNIQLNSETSRESFVEFRHARDKELKAPKLLFQSVQINVFGGTLPSPGESGVRYLKIPINFKPPTDSAGRPVGARQDAPEVADESVPRARGGEASFDCKSIFGGADDDGFHLLSASDLPGALARCPWLRVVDVREPAEFVGELGHVEGAESVPLGAISSAQQLWGKSDPIVFICHSGRRSEIAARSLAEKGFKRLAHVPGGMLAVRAAGA